jgi:hypothetical protein
MATKLTITIPDKLAEELKPWRKRMNISKVCASAIAAEMDILKGLSPANGEIAHVDWSNLVSRLRAEKQGLQARDYQIGYDTGIARAESLSYSDFLHYEEIANSQIRFQDLDEDEREEFMYQREEGLVTDGKAYARGFVDGLMLIWGKIRDKV